MITAKLCAPTFDCRTSHYKSMCINLLLRTTSAIQRCLEPDGGDLLPLSHVSIRGGGRRGLALPEHVGWDWVRLSAGQSSSPSANWGEILSASPQLVEGILLKKQWQWLIKMLMKAQDHSLITSEDNWTVSNFLYCPIYGTIKGPLSTFG